MIQSFEYVLVLYRLGTVSGTDVDLGALGCLKKFIQSLLHSILTSINILVYLILLEIEFGHTIIYQSGGSSRLSTVIFFEILWENEKAASIQSKTQAIYIVHHKYCLKD